MFFLGPYLQLISPVRSRLSHGDVTHRQTIYRGPRQSLARLSKNQTKHKGLFLFICNPVTWQGDHTGVKSTWVIPLFSHVARLIRENAWHGAASIIWICRVNLLICDEGSEVRLLRTHVHYALTLEPKSASEKQMALNLSAELRFTSRTLSLKNASHDWVSHLICFAVCLFPAVIVYFGNWEKWLLLFWETQFCFLYNSKRKNGTLLEKTYTCFYSQHEFKFPKEMMLNSRKIK